MLGKFNKTPLRGELENPMARDFGSDWRAAKAAMEHSGEARNATEAHFGLNQPSAEEAQVLAHIETGVHFQDAIRRDWYPLQGGVRHWALTKLRWKSERAGTPGLSFFLEYISYIIRFALTEYFHIIMKILFY